MSSAIEGRIVWVTGSGRGIGAATALLLASRGARVVLSARTSGEIQEVADRIRRSGGQALPMRCDVTLQAEIHNLLKLVKSTWGAVEILINNAGIAVFKKIVHTSEDEWDAMMSANVKSAFLCTQAVLPDMIEVQSGHIVNIISVAGKQPYESSGAYCASKYGLAGFTDVLRLEMRKFHIRVTAVYPGAVNTGLWDSVKADRSKMMHVQDIAKIIVEACDHPPAVGLEEVVIRPASGDIN